MTGGDGNSREPLILRDHGAVVGVTKGAKSETGRKKFKFSVLAQSDTSQRAANKLIGWLLNRGAKRQPPPPEK